MNVYIPGYIPPVPDPKKDVQTLPKELMSSTPGMSGPMSIPTNMSVPTQNMSTPPQSAPMSIPKAPPTPMVDPIGRNFTGVPQALTPIQQQTAKEIPPMTVEPTGQQKNDKIFNAVIDRVTGEPQTTSIPEFEYEKASRFFDTINLDKDETDYIDYAVKQGYDFKDAMLYISLRRQRQNKELEKNGGFLGAVDRIMMAPYRGIYSAMESMSTGITG